MSPYTVLQTLTSCYNVFYTSGTTAYKLSNNYNGSGNGLTGEVFALAAAYNGDLYIGGDFGLAGGYNHTSNFSCYRFHNGWSGVNEVEVNGPVWTLTWSSYKLQLWGDFDQVNGPITSGGSVYNSINNLPGEAYWNNFWTDFPNAYGTAN